MFHVNAWGLPYLAPMAGASLIMPGRQLDPVSLLALLNDEGATFSVGVPTVWLNLIAHMRQTGESFRTLQRIFAGGAAFPRALIPEFEQRGVSVRHGWGMTESSPVVTFNAPKPATACGSTPRRPARPAGQAGPRASMAWTCAPRTRPGEVPRDGATQGNLVFRGHWVANGYFRLPETEIAPDAWFPTGDVGVVDSEGFVLLTDRTKDLIKSGGEWISSIALENIAVGHPDVAEAAAIAAPDEKWGERPLLVVVAARRVVNRSPTTCAPFSPARCRTGRSPTASSSPRNCPTARPARSSRRNCAGFMRRPRGEHPSSGWTRIA